jgi:thioredoxin 1
MVLSLILAAFVGPIMAEGSGAKAVQGAAATKPIVTFIELGSVNCVPCRAMQPVMDSIRKKYSDQVSVLFYDVWTKQGEPYGRQYRIRVIPTQVFLDKDGKEYYRHEGFLPEEEVKKILKKGGVKL